MLQTWLYAYVAVWLMTLATAMIVALAGKPLSGFVKGLLGLALSARRNSSPSLGRVLMIAAHNVPIACWPLLLGLLDAQQRRLSRHVADWLVVACLVANVLPVGAAFGAYGLAVIPYVPQLPLEWAGLALGASGWLAYRHRPLTRKKGLSLFGLLVYLMVCAASLETFGVPHR